MAARLWIDNWRWEDVPFFLRHGKKLPIRNTEITVVFRRAPDYLFQELGLEHVPANHLTVRIQPDEGISLAFQAKDPGPGYELQTVRMDFDYDRSFDEALRRGVRAAAARRDESGTTRCSPGPTTWSAHGRS